MSPNPNDMESYAKHEMSHSSRLLNKFKKIRYQKTHNLLTGQTEKSEEEQKKSEIMSAEIVSHWHPNLTINVVTDQTNWMKGNPLFLQEKNLRHRFYFTQSKFTEENFLELSKFEFTFFTFQAVYHSHSMSMCNSAKMV